MSDVEHELLVAMAAHSTALRVLHAAGGDVEQLKAAVVVAHERALLTQREAAAAGLRRTAGPGAVDRLVLGAVLRQVRDQRLYRATHRTFRDYVVDVVGISRSTAYRLIAKETP